MTVAATLLVQADLSGTAFGGAPTWTDVTRFVRLVDGVDINSWRQDALSQIAPSTMNLTLDNDALPGDATAPNAGRFTPGLSTSPWAGKLLPGVRFRLSETVSGTTYVLFDGYAIDWTTQPGADDGTFPVTKVNCTDILAWMGQLQPLRSIAIEEMQLDAPASLYPLDEAAGATTAGDVYGGQAAATITPATASVGTASYAFGATMPYIGNATGLQLTSPDIAAGIGARNARAYYLSVPNQLPANGVGWSIVTAFYGATVPSGALKQTLWSIGAPDDTTNTVLLSVEPTNGKLELDIGGGAIFSQKVADGGLHVAVVTLSADGKTVTMVVDGQVYTGTTASSFGPQSTYLPISVGARLFAGGDAGYPFGGTVAFIAQYRSVLSTARATDYYNAIATAFAGERTDTHAARLLSYRPNTGSSLDVGNGTVGVHNTEGVTLTDALFATAKAEGGLVFADAGNVILRNRARLRDPASAATFDVEADLTSDYQARIDMQQLVNDMTVTRAGGANARVKNATSIAAYGPRQQSDTYLVNTDRDAYDAAGWLVANQKDAAVRTPIITADVVTMTSAAQAQAALARLPLDRITLGNLPSWAPPTAVAVQGRTIHIDKDTLSVGFYTSALPRKTLRADAAASANTKLDNGLVIAW